MRVEHKGKWQRAAEKRKEEQEFLAQVASHNQIVYPCMLVLKSVLKFYVSAASECLPHQDRLRGSVKASFALTFKNGIKKPDSARHWLPLQKAL